MKKEDELVLCIPNTGIDGFAKTEVSYENATFLRRGDVENDPTYHQIIPYIVIRNSKGEILTYRRGTTGGEDRLHNLYSIGIGGHINNEDFEGDFHAAIENAIVREVKEELNLDLDNDFEYLQHIGWFACNATEVDRVHLAKLYILQISDDAISKIFGEEDVIEKIQFLHPDKVKELNLENWAKIALEAI